MSMLAALTLDMEKTLLPASTLSWRAEFLKIPGHYEPLAGATDGHYAHGTEAMVLAGDGFSDWMTERVDFSSLLMESGDPSLPSPPLPDLEAMASLLKKELEQMEDYFLEESLSPGLGLDQVAPSTPPSHQPAFHFPFGDGSGPAGSFPHFGSDSPTPLQTLDSGCLELLNLYGTGVPSGECPGQGRLEEYIGSPPAAKRSRPNPLEQSAVLPQQKGDRKQKKRDQNKTAALRYRQRKRAEYEALDDECQGLEARNRELKEKADSIEREIQYVKDLLIEVYKARSQRLRAS
uniref:Activating transcription factor 5 n=1 Tax=Pelodiscus sinensis TaxID=13735 RepID=K7G7W7_PELSI|nr:cyclic AMP-dependent transcription factor ATF-5 [Pelodiscus sinensis]|eukprot:XP_006133052.1 cyclic AMP-dependent transcription factor ATF-5 [Pelodiscus sinensis]